MKLELKTLEKEMFLVESGKENTFYKQRKKRKNKEKCFHEKTKNRFQELSLKKKERKLKKRRIR